MCRAACAPTDVHPTRITAAQIAAKAFIKDQPSKVKIGIVAFSGAAFLVQAPTTDTVALDQAIDSLRPEYDRHRLGRADIAADHFPGECSSTPWCRVSAARNSPAAWR